jgi:hypothetical protein
VGRRVPYTAAVLAFAAAAYAISDETPLGSITANSRLQMLRGAQVWTRTDVAAKNLRDGPAGRDAFAPDHEVACRFIPKTFDGATPKFECVLADGDQVKVKYGRDNGEVYAEVAASRLLWALGFGADAQYPVVVVCRGCSRDPWHDPAPAQGTITFDPAIIEENFTGTPIESNADRTRASTAGSWRSSERATRSSSTTARRRPPGACPHTLRTRVAMFLPVAVRRVTCSLTSRPTRSISSSDSDSYTGTCTAVAARSAPGIAGPFQPNNFMFVQTSTCIGATSTPRRMHRLTSVWPSGT